MPANLQFKRGSLSNLAAQSIKDGTIYVTTDERAMYLDYGTKRIRLGDFIPVNTIADLPAAGHAYDTAVYYVKEGNILARWDIDNSRWIQINKAGIVGVQTTGSGNIISDISTTVALDGTLQLAVTKTTVASSEDLIALANRVTSAEGNINTINSKINIINGDTETAGSMLNVAATVKSALLGSETQYKNFKEICDDLRDLLSRMASAESSITSLSNAMTSVQGAITTLNGGPNVEGSIDNKVSAAVAAVIDDAPAAFDTLKEIATWIQNHPDVATITSAIDNLNTSTTTLQGKVTTLETKMTAAENDIDDLEAAIDILNSDDTVVNSIEYKIKSATNELQTSIANLNNTVTIHEQCLTWIDFNSNV